jgi:hypothetical protein
MRYAAATDRPRPPDVERGWISEGSASLKMNVSSGLERASLVMLTDVSSSLRRDDNHKFRSLALTRNLQWAKSLFECLGFRIVRDDLTEAIRQMSRRFRLFSRLSS